MGKGASIVLRFSNRELVKYVYFTSFQTQLSQKRNLQCNFVILAPRLILSCRIS